MTRALSYALLLRSAATWCVVNPARDLPTHKDIHMKILMVLTSHDQLGDTGKNTGFWLEEFAAP